MADGTGIEWADATWNPIRARDRDTGKIGWFCTHASDGCRFCYAETFNHRLGTGIAYRAQDAARIEIFIDEKILAQPLHWHRPRKIFTLSMSDLFGEFVPDALIDRVFAIMALAPQHNFLVLTKRARRMREYVSDEQTPYRIARESDALSSAGALEWPLPNCWKGVSVEDQPRADERIPELLATPAAKRFVSCEPLLGPTGLDLIPVAGTFGIEPAIAELDWVIAGGESGPGARPMHPDWARSLRDQCVAAGVPFFFKQWGEWHPCEIYDDCGPCYPMPGHAPFDSWTAPLFAPDDRGPGWNWRRLGKKAAGRRLDGREWSEMPA
ncbi:MAG TPA: phage Gp37/Gp68 family protein [Stellaceae bacterium]|nr:phage Gp37/Gp68 family protein [Stellaceae bacterium]